MCILETWKKFGKPGKIFEKTSGNPELKLDNMFFFEKF